MTAKDYIEIFFTWTGVSVVIASLWIASSYLKFALRANRRRRKVKKQSQILSDVFVGDTGELFGISIKSPKR